ncbi:putative nucleic acid-binding Zn-ribbon protein [Elusimicrobium simillimum]|uniref:hypothetical protein n=1 Tax=Elusimicrobium simillimum TaxID=3143438 RepID=UPI003C6FDDFA
MFFNKLIKDMEDIEEDMETISKGIREVEDDIKNIEKSFLKYQEMVDRYIEQQKNKNTDVRSEK